MSSYDENFIRCYVYLFERLDLQIAQLLSKAVDSGPLACASETVSLTGHAQNDFNLAVIARVGLSFRNLFLAFT